MKSSRIVEDSQFNQDWNDEKTFIIWKFITKLSLYLNMLIDFYMNTYFFLLLFEVFHFLNVFSLKNGNKCSPYEEKESKNICGWTRNRQLINS